MLANRQEMKSIHERDWKLLRAMKDDALSDACDNILSKIDKVLKNKKTTSHQKYLCLWKLIRKEDDKIAAMFNDLRRSTALLKLASWKKNGVLSEEQLEQFSESTQESINFWSENIKR